MVNKLKVLEFLVIATAYTDAWTPTKVNSGGCGFFAEKFVAKLKEKGIPYKIWAIWATSHETAKEGNHGFKNFIKSGTGIEKVGIEHIVIETFKGWFFDSDGVASKYIKMAWDKKELTEEQLKKLNETETIWNGTFDRDCVPFMEEKLNEAFSDFPKYAKLKMPKPHEVQLTEHTMRYINPFGSFIASLEAA